MMKLAAPAETSDLAVIEQRRIKGDEDVPP